MDLTPTHRRTLECWYEAYHEQNERFEIPIHFARVVAGDKPATILQSTDWDFPESPFDSEEQVLAFVRDIGLSMHHMDKGRSQYVGRSDRLDVLPSTAGMTNEEWHRRLGTAFGYPEDAIEWFIRDEERIEPRDRVERDDFTPEEMAYVTLVAYANEDSIEGYERAIEEGQRIRTLLAELADEWDLPILDRLAEDHYQLSLAVYSGERNHFPGECTGFKMVTTNPAPD